MKLIILALCSLLLTSCGVIKGHSNWFVDQGIKTVDSLYVPDNPVEQNIEKAIKSVTGLEVDISPDSEPQEADNE